MRAKTLPQAVACYCRVSTENQIENYSIEEQRERLEAFCRAKGWSKPVMFIDPGFSGGTLERPALRSLLADVERGRFGTVVVYKLDRLSRSQKKTLNRRARIDKTRALCYNIIKPRKRGTSYDIQRDRQNIDSGRLGKKEHKRLARSV